MRQPEKQSESEPEQKGKRTPTFITPAQRLQELSQVQHTTGDSLGEALLPVLVSALETCLVDAVLICLANFNFFGSRETLIPFWAPFVFIAGSFWLFRRSTVSAVEASVPTGDGEDDDDETKTANAGLAPLVAAGSILVLFLIWLHVYAQTAFVLDPRWIFALLNDILLLNARLYQAIAILGLSLFLCWRGLQLAQKVIEPYDAFKRLYLGLGIIVPVILLRASVENTGLPVIAANDTLLLILIPIFLFFSLATHALARITFIRRDHPLGLQGSIVAQERALLSVLGVVGLILLLVTLLVSGAFFASTLHALVPIWAAIVTVYDWLAQLLALIITILATPIFWLVGLWSSRIPNRPPAIRPTPVQRPNLKRPPSQLDTTSPYFILLVKILLPLLLLLGLVLLIRWTLRRRKRIQMKRGQRSGDTRESVWSWALFWQQFRAFWRLLFAHFFPRTAKTAETPLVMEEIVGEPAARSIREIYRALLKKAAYRGYARKRNETPYEFQQRLDEQVPVVEPQLAVITESYALTRYGGNVPDESEVVRVRDVWSELDRKWE